VMALPGAPQEIRTEGKFLLNRGNPFSKIFTGYLYRFYANQDTNAVRINISLSDPLHWQSLILQRHP
jgi:hypothetical protein